ncbi:hypothetical protein AURDEDRAFT_178974 [Auricularia subglabra TFB-10046 SS5]|nr:hypothetical protein AURDEDRAFT_178974 [Auricularia subglabra TFB-10046 SS5]
MSLLIAAALSVASVAALQYSYTAPTQCDPFTVKWSDGEPPFTVQLSVGFASPTIIELPDSAWNGKSGSHTMTLNVAAGKNFIITMYDKGGFATGVNSGVLSVGSSVTNSTCDTSPNKADFTYRAPDALTQCNPYSFLDYPGATLPVRVNGIIANGAIFTRNAGDGDSAFQINVDVRAGTKLVLWMQDARGRSGGASEVLTVLSAPEDGCIGPSSPGPTEGSTPSQISSGDSGTSTGAIAAAVIGTLIAFAAIGAFIFMRRRRNMNKKNEGVLADPYMARHSRHSSRFSNGRRNPSVDLLAANRAAYEQRSPGMPSPSTPARSMLGHGYPMSASGGETGRAHEGAFDNDPSLTPDPFLGEPTPRTPSSFQTQQTGESGPGRRSSTSKASYGPGGRVNFAHPRFILHTDAGALEEEEVVELPPMYTDTRSNTSAGASGSGKSRLPPPPPIPDDDHANRPISYNSAITLPRGPRTERTLSFGAASSVATGYDDPVLERSVSQRERSSYAESASHHAMSSDGSQRPLRPRNPDDDDDDDDHPAPGGSSHPQYDFLDDPEFDRSDREGDSSSDVQLAYAAPASEGLQHPLAQPPARRAGGGMQRMNTAPVVSRNASSSLRPSASRANSAHTPR